MRLAHQRFSSEMQDTLDGIARKSAPDIFYISEVSFDQCSVMNKGSVPGGKVVENDGRKSGRFKRLDRVDADVPGSPGYEDHETLLRK